MERAKKEDMNRSRGTEGGELGRRTNTDGRGWEGSKRQK